jgi:hypothetical protein
VASYSSSPEKIRRRPSKSNEANVVKVLTVLLELKKSLAKTETSLAYLEYTPTKLKKGFGLDPEEVGLTVDRKSGYLVFTDNFNVLLSKYNLY